MYTVDLLKALLSAVIGITISLCGCTSSGPPSLDAREQAKLEEKRKSRVEELARMNNTQLATSLAADSEKGVEPFNSMAYRELVSRGDKAATELKETLKAPNRSSFLGLLALRKVSPDQYKTLDANLRARILVDSLRTSQNFNAWGIPHLFWEDGAKAIIDEGPAIEEPLVELLKDKARAPIWGSEGAVEQQKYGYRVCDYAWALLNEIRKTKVEIPVNPADRDKLIEPLLKDGR